MKVFEDKLMIFGTKFKKKLYLNQIYCCKNMKKIMYILHAENDQKLNEINIFQWFFLIYAVKILHIIFSIRIFYVQKWFKKMLKKGQKWLFSILSKSVKSRPNRVWDSAKWSSWLFDQFFESTKNTVRNS